jgi:hypothetical protein
MKLSEIKNSDFYDEDEDIILADNLLSEIIYISIELYDILFKSNSKKKKLKKLKLQIRFSLKKIFEKG